MFVDTHTHVVAPDRKRYPLTPVEASGGWYREAPVSVEELVAAMDEAGVDRAVLVQAVSAYRFDNRYALDCSRANTARCTSVVCTDLGTPDATATVRRLVGDGARGLRWWALADESLAEPRDVWDLLASARLPVVITMFARRLEELDGLLEVLPPAPIALDHCAFADFSSGVPAQLRAIARHPAVTLKVSTIVLDGLAEHGDVRDGLAEIASCFGADRLMWGSDYSQTHDRSYAELAELARHAARGLDHDAREAFLGGTALRMWPELAR
jgi:L-fuconolactonase